MNTVTLLIEIGTEELPTRAVTELASAGAQLWDNVLTTALIPHGEIEAFGTPRRLAWRVRQLAVKQTDQKIERKGPSLQAAKDKNNAWTKAALGFAASCGVDVEQLAIETTEKGQWLIFRGEKIGENVADLLPDLFAEVMDKLPIAKRMRWGDCDHAFVRPVHNLLVLADDNVWDLEFFGVASQHLSQGHRVHHAEPVAIRHAKTYEADLEAAYVIVDHETRCNRIREQVQALARDLGGKALMPEALVKEVASLTEWPIAIAGAFDRSFLKMPPEVLITTMQDHQKTFAVMDTLGTLLPYFIAVANLESQNEEEVRKGNEKVIRPRFADAEFFWQQDLKRPLEDYLPQLERVIYQEKLGTLAEKTRRVQTIACELTAMTAADKNSVYTAARLAKSDLQTAMVQEFPELQGVMGRYYALHQGLSAEVAQALEEQYFPTAAGDKLPQTAVGITLSIAEKLDTLIGGFSIGAQPTGSKDPYALRRMAIGLIRLLIEKKVPLLLTPWLEKAAGQFHDALGAKNFVMDVRAYILERLQAYYREQNIAPEIVQAVLALNGDNLVDIDQRVRALAPFSNSDAALSFFASAKRIRNILKKNGTQQTAVRTDLLQESAEKHLWQQWKQMHNALLAAVSAGNYETALQQLGSLAEPLEAFFAQVMVMTENPDVQINRLALLTALQKGFELIADLSIISNL